MENEQKNMLSIQSVKKKKRPILLNVNVSQAAGEIKIKIFFFNSILW